MIRRLALVVVLLGGCAGVVGAQNDQAALLYRQSQNYAATQQPALALASIERALQLRPDDPEYLQSAAVISTWMGDYARAREAYERLRRVAPDRSDVLLALARVNAWAGETDEAAALLREYLRTQPDDRAAWLDLARVELWRDNHTRALAALDEYLTRFGESDARQLIAAQALTGAGRSDEAVDILAPLVAGTPTDHDLARAFGVALAADDRLRDSQQVFRSLQASDPGNPQTASASRVARTIAGSSVSPIASFYSDSDHLETMRAGWSVVLALPSATRVLGGYEHQQLDAPVESGLAAHDGRTVSRKAGWLGVAQAIGPVTLNGRLGSSFALDRHELDYAFGARARVGGGVTVSFERRHGPFVASPKTVERGLIVTRHGATADWSPAIGIQVAFDGSIEELSDGNRRWSVTGTPTMAVARTEHLNLELGASVYRLETSRNLNNGYYDPARYESYAAVAAPYWKVSSEIGIGAWLAFGAHREAPGSFRLGGHASADATVGIFSTWAVRASAVVSNIQRPESGAFRGGSASITLIRRF